MFVMYANSFLLALDMLRSKCIFYFIYTLFDLALQQAHGCGGQLPIYQGWYIASPLPSQVNYYSPSIRKVHHEPMETLSFGPICLVPPFLPYPYEIFHVQRIIQPSEDVTFPEQLPYEDIEHYEVPVYETEMEEEEDVDVPVAANTGESEDLRSTPYPDNYYLPHHMINQNQLSVATAVTDNDHSMFMPQSPQSEEYGAEPEPIEQEEEEEIEPDIWAHYFQAQAYEPQYETEEEVSIPTEEVFEVTEAPCNVEQTTVQEEILESTPIPETPQQIVPSASALSQQHQELLAQIQDQYESEEEMSPCDGYFEKNAATLARMLEQHFDHRHVRGSRSEGSEHADASRLFTPIIRALKNIFGSFMSLTDKPTESKGKPTDSEPVTTERLEAPKQEATTKPPEVSPPTTTQEVPSPSTPEPESGATETPAPGVEERASGAESV